MAKKQKTSSPRSSGGVNIVEQEQAPVANGDAAYEGFSIMSFRMQAIIIGVLGIIFYFNSFFNEYALDDRPIIVENEFVKQGLAGIPKIFTSDAFESYFSKQNSGNPLTGGRYRPLSIVTFAIEQQILGLPETDAPAANNKEIKPYSISDEAQAKAIHDMHARHVVNVLLYVLSVIVLLYFLRTIVFPGNYIVPFLTAILFLVHPIHTEVVANVKSRDEIMSLLFICLTFIYAFRYHDGRKQSSLIKALLCFFLALLSKEYAITLIVLLPLAFYLFRNESFGKGFRSLVPYLIPLGLYFAMRISVISGGKEGVPDNIMNVPYLYATGVQKIASIVAILLTYVQLLVFPHPLASDYSYNQIPYRDLASPMFWASLVFYAGVIGAFLVLLRKRHVLAFALGFYLLNLLLISNILVNIGAPMGERLIYHSSLGFVMVVAWLLYNAFNKMLPGKTGQLALAGVAGIIVVCSAFKTIDRNKDWKNDKTLFLRDVEAVPNNNRILGNAGSACIDMGDPETDKQKQADWYRKGIKFLDRSIAINPKFADAYQNRGVCYYKLGFADKAVADWDSVKLHYPTNPNLAYLYSIASNYYFKHGIESGNAGRHEDAILNFRKAAHVTPQASDIWFNIGFASYSINKFSDAAEAFGICMRLDPKNVRAKQMYEQAKAQIK